MKIRRIFALLLGATALLGLWSKSERTNWGQFRGPGGAGVALDAQSLPAVFNDSTNVLWKTPLAPGHSSPIIWDERIFLTAFENEKLTTLCFNRSDGKVLWRREAPAEKIEKGHKIHSPAASTPVTDGQRVFVYFGSYGLLCYDFSGEVLWQRPLPIPKNTFGSAASPIIAGDFLIFNHDSNEKSWLEAIDPKSGETVWRTEREGFGSGWSTPTLWRRNGVDELVVYGVWWLKAYDLKDGSERWAVPGLADEPSITPVIGDGMVFVTSYNMKTNLEVEGLPEFKTLLEKYDADKNGQLNREESKKNKSILSRHDADGEGDHPLSIFFRFLDVNRDDQISEKEWAKIVAWVDGFEQENALLAIRPRDDGQEPEIVWKHIRGVPEIPSPLYLDGNVYILKNGGIISCLDAQTGALKYMEKLGSGGPYYASTVVGDGKIFASSARGVITVFKPGDALTVLAKNDLQERIMATPALCESKIYVRTEKALYAFSDED
mgnify:CR=1 FL=1